MLEDEQLVDGWHIRFCSTAARMRLMSCLYPSASASVKFVAMRLKMASKSKKTKGLPVVMFATTAMFPAGATGSDIAVLDAISNRGAPPSLATAVASAPEPPTETEESTATAG